jgi:site-specific DNA recombinase
MAHVRGAVAEYELLKFKERARRGRLGRAKEGHPPGGRVSFGYRYVKHPKRGAHYAIAEEEAAIVRRIFDLYVHAKMSQEAIAALFTAEGVPKSFDFHPQFRRKLAVRVWHQSTISAILRNTAYIGTLNYNKKTAIAGKGNADKKTRWQALPEEEWIPIDVPAIITQDLFDAAQEQRKRNATNSSRNRKHAYLFINGRLRCGQCGYAMSGSHTSSGIQYICGRRPYLHFIDPHTRRSVLGTVIEEPVWQDIMAKLKDPQKIATALDHLRHQADDQQITLDQEKDPYLRQLVKCDRELHLAEAAYFGEAMDLSAYKRKTADIALRRQRVEKELARLEEMEQDAARRVAYTDALHTYCARVVQNLTSFDLQEKRDLFETMDIRVTWYPDKPYEITGLLELQIDNKEP